MERIIVEKFNKFKKNGFWYLLKCNYCKNDFQYPGYQFNLGGGLYCSKKCYGLNKATKRKCLICNKEWFTSHFTPKGKKYCSQKCMAVAYKNEGNPCWRGGTSRLPYHHTFRDKLKNMIRKRDNYTCYICEKSNLSTYDAHVHHYDGNKLNCSDINLVTICRWCHGLISAKGINDVVYYKYFYLIKN